MTRLADGEGEIVKVIAVIGSGSGSGKTTLVCRLLRSLPGLGAVKISPRDSEPRIEWGPGAGGADKDTARYAACGAGCVARLVGPRDRIRSLWKEAEPRMAACGAVVVEGTGALAIGEARFTILVVGRRRAMEQADRIGMLLGKADLVVINVNTHNAEDAGIVDAYKSHRLGSQPIFVCNLMGPNDRDFSDITERLQSFLSGCS
jgi:Ni2+-binding GTPase involved in maturation of urease and hydrogenase